MYAYLDAHSYAYGFCVLIMYIMIGTTMHNVNSTNTTNPKSTAKQLFVLRKKNENYMFFAIGEFHTSSCLSKKMISIC